MRQLSLVLLCLLLSLEPQLCKCATDLRTSARTAQVLGGDADLEPAPCLLRDLLHDPRYLGSFPIPYLLHRASRALIHPNGSPKTLTLDENLEEREK